MFLPPIIVIKPFSHESLHFLTQLVRPSLQACQCRNQLAPAPVNASPLSPLGLQVLVGSFLAVVRVLDGSRYVMIDLKTTATVIQVVP